MSNERQIVERARNERRLAAAIGAGAAAAIFVVFVIGGVLDWVYAGVGWIALASLLGIHLAAMRVADEGALRRASEAAPPPPPAPVPEPAPRAGVAPDSAAQMIELIPEPVLVVDRSGRIEGANAAARTQFKLTRTKALLTSVVREPVVVEAVNDISAGGRSPMTVEYRAAGADERHMRAFVAPIEAEQDARPALNAMIVFYDQTAAKRMERTRLDFLANASHELRTPLASLSGFIETLRGHAKDDPTAREKFLAIMGAQADRMRRLINDLLSLSRIELNEHVPPTGAADLVGVAVDVIDAIAPLARQRDIVVTLDRQADRAPVLGDRDELLQVLQNLVDNALKFTPSGGRVSVTVGAGARSDEAAYDGAAGSKEVARLSILAPQASDASLYAWVRVRDQGPGIDRRHLPRLSERFFRVEAAQTERSGTGLGLAIVKHIMNRHRGGLTVESELSKGTVFSVYAPHTPEFAAEFEQRPKAGVAAVGALSVS